MPSEQDVLAAGCPPDGRHRDEFSQLVRKIVIYEHRGVLGKLASALGLSYGAFYNRLNGRGAFDPHEVNLLLHELEDPRLVDCLLSGTEFQALRKTSTFGAHSDRDVIEIALSCALKTLNAVQATVQAITCSGFDRENSMQIETTMGHAQHELSMLQFALSEVDR